MTAYYQSLIPRFLSLCFCFSICGVTVPRRGRGMTLASQHKQGDSETRDKTHECEERVWIRDPIASFPRAQMVCQPFRGENSCTYSRGE